MSDSELKKEVFSKGELEELDFMFNNVNECTLEFIRSFSSRHSRSEQQVKQYFTRKRKAFRTEIIKNKNTKAGSKIPYTLFPFEKEEMVMKYEENPSPGPMYYIDLARKYDLPVIRIKRWFKQRRFRAIEKESRPPKQPKIPAKIVKKIGSKQQSDMVSSSTCHDMVSSTTIQPPPYRKPIIDSTLGLMESRDLRMNIDFSENKSTKTQSVDTQTTNDNGNDINIPKPTYILTFPSACTGVIVNGPILPGYIVPIIQPVQVSPTNQFTEIKTPPDPDTVTCADQVNFSVSEGRDVNPTRVRKSLFPSSMAEDVDVSFLISSQDLTVENFNDSGPVQENENPVKLQSSFNFLTENVKDRDVNFQNSWNNVPSMTNYQSSVPDYQYINQSSENYNVSNLNCQDNGNILSTNYVPNDEEPRGCDYQIVSPEIFQNSYKGSLYNEASSYNESDQYNNWDSQYSCGQYSLNSRANRFSETSITKAVDTYYSVKSILTEESTVRTERSYVVTAPKSREIIKVTTPENDKTSPSGAFEKHTNNDVVWGGQKWMQCEPRNIVPYNRNPISHRSWIYNSTIPTQYFNNPFNYHDICKSDYRPDDYYDSQHQKIPCNVSNSYVNCNYESHFNKNKDKIFKESPRTPSPPNYSDIVLSNNLLNTPRVPINNNFEDYNNYPELLDLGLDQSLYSFLSSS